MSAGSETGDTAGHHPAEGGSIPTPALHDLRFSEISRSDADSCVRKWHYSRSLNGVKHRVCYGIVRPRLLGAAVFGAMATTCWKKFSDSEGSVLELRRLAVSDDCPKNTESRFVGWCIREIRKLGQFSVIVSYADPAHGHTGTIYKALGFRLDGETPPDTGWLFNGRTYHSRAARTKYAGRLKPFAARLAAAISSGEAAPIHLPGKIRYILNLTME